MDAQNLMRTGESLYRELGLAQRDLTPDEAVRILHEHPQLMERPIVVSARRAVIGRPPERVEELL